MSLGLQVLYAYTGKVANHLTIPITKLDLPVTGTRVMFTDNISGSPHELRSGDKVSFSPTLPSENTRNMHNVIIRFQTENAKFKSNVWNLRPPMK